MLKFLFYFCVFTLSMGQFSSISKNAGLNIYLYDIAVALFSIAGGFHFLIVRKKLHLPKVFIPFCCFASIAILSLALVAHSHPPLQLLTAAFYLVRWSSYLASGVVINNMLSQGMLSRNQVLQAFIRSALFISLAGFVQLILLPDFEVLDPSLGWDPHKNRLGSTFFDPNFVGAYLVLCITLVLHRILIKKDLRAKTLFFLGIFFVALILTFSRSAWLMFGVVVLVYGVLKAHFLVLLSFLLFFSAYYAVPRIQTRLSGIADPADSAHFRLISWGNTLEIIKDNPVFGVGFNAYRYAQKEYGFLDQDTVHDHAGAGSDSSLLFVVATTGIVGLISYLWGFGGSVLLAFKQSKSTAILLLALTFSLLGNSQFINSLFYPQIMFLVFSLYGVLLVDWSS
jgi:O-antigen ligase